MMLRCLVPKDLRKTRGVILDYPGVFKLRNEIIWLGLRKCKDGDGKFGGSRKFGAVSPRA